MRTGGEGKLGGEGTPATRGRIAEESNGVAALTTSEVEQPKNKEAPSRSLLLAQHEQMVLTGRKAKVSTLPGLPKSTNMSCRATASCGVIVPPQGGPALPQHTTAQPAPTSKAGGALTMLKCAWLQLCSEDGSGGLGGWKCAERLNRKLLLHHTTQGRLCLAEQDVRFPGGRCLIRLLLMLTLCIFFALSPFFLYYFLLWFDVVGI